MTAMPTFLFFKNKEKIDMCKGADKVKLEAKLKEHGAGAGGEDAGGEDDSPVKGHVSTGRRWG